LIPLTSGPVIEAQVIATDTWNRDEILISVVSEAPSATAVRRVNTRTGASRLIEESAPAGGPGFPLQHFAASGLELRAASRPTASGGLSAAFRDSVRETWLELGRWDLPDAIESRVLGVAADGRTFYVSDSRGRACAALCALRVGGDGQMNYEVLAEHASADLAEIACHPRSGHVQAAAFDGLRREWIVIDQAVREDWTILQEFAGEDAFAIVSRDRADRRWIVQLRPLDRPPSFFLYERLSQRISRLFGEDSERNHPVPETSAIAIAVRDGLQLPSYLTMPVDIGRSRRAAVIIIHDGPWSRAGPGFDPLHQWLASRGCAALSVNYRGSTGFGRDFAIAGHREWAGAIQDDIIDAALWLIDEGVAHPDRIVLMGEGFGGYCVLTAMSATPDFFVAGIAIDPFVSLPRLAQAQKSERDQALFSARIAPLDDVELLELLSPINHADSIVHPLLLARTHDNSPLAVDDLGKFHASLNARGVLVKTVDVAGANLPSRSARWMAVLDEVERLLSLMFSVEPLDEPVPGLLDEIPLDDGGGS
jgi:dipeptidyl aminopeptidase/acylaminoacyl peptidase